MDTIFSLETESRTRILQQAAGLLGCAYICLWSPLHHASSNVLSCMDAWLREEDGTGTTLSSTQFEAYRGSFCTVITGCVPGWAFKERLSYFELHGSSLMSSASSQVQQQFYQEYGIKTAVFIGCQNGEIEFGMTTSPAVNLQVMVRQVFTEDFIQQILLNELLQLPKQQVTSSSSSLPSLSIGSPEYSSLINISKGSRNTSLSPRPLSPLMQTYSQYPNPQWESDDMAMARAMLAVISSSTTSTSSSSQIGEITRSINGAFKPYKSGLEPVMASTSIGSQRMIKRALALLRRIFMTRFVGVAQQEVEVRPTRSQLHHVFSERKRREKLNESFDALRKLLPPGSKRDKASVLINTKEYVNKLIEQIAKLEEKNEKLEAQLSRTEQSVETQTLEADESNERIQVVITRAPESTSSWQQINLQIVMRDECDFTDLIIRTLRCLKEIGSFNLVSVDAIAETPRFARANITLHLPVGDYDEASLKEIVKKTVEEATT